MKILVPAIGSRGDVQPYIALCQGLRDAGHQVTLATNPTLCALVSSYGVEAVPVGPSVDMGLEGARLWAKSGNNMWLGLIRVMRLASRLIEQAYPDILPLAAQADLVVVSDPTAGAAEAERLGVPWISATLQPGRVPTPNPSPTLSQRVFGSLVWPLFSKLMVMPINRYRQRVGAPKVSDISSMLSTRMLLVGVSPNVSPPNPLWAPHVKVTGYWTSREPSGWSPPDDLLHFLEAGPAPVAISLGVMSLAGGQAKESAQIALQAVRQAGLRAILQGWDESMLGPNLPASIYRAGSMPHTWLFDRVSAVVHHGGFGTTASTLRAGVPGIVVPHIIDQFYWGQRVTEMGVGPMYIPRSKLSVASLADALTQATSNTAMRNRAAELGRRIRSEPDGVQTTVSLIESL
jgi:sterol 3beta-glucosyltransferase